MFNFKKLSILVCSLFYFLTFCVSDTLIAYDKFAKVVVIGEYRSGKTTLYNAIRGNADKVIHTEQISNDNCLTYDITERVWHPNRGIKSWFKKGKYVNENTSVGVYLFDTSGEEQHEDLMRQFCKGAHVAILTLDAEKLVKERCYIKGYFSLQGLTAIIDDISLYAPDCKVIVVLTKYQQALDKYGEKYKSACNQILDLDNLKDAIKGTFPRLKVDKIYRYDTSVDRYWECQANMQNMIKECISDYGLYRLPEVPDGLRANVTNVYAGQKTVYYEEPFFFGLFSTTKSYQTDNYVPALNWH